MLDVSLNGCSTMVAVEPDRFRIASPVVESKVFVDASPIHGRGLFARTFIPAGEEIGTIEGHYTTTDGDHVLWIDEHTGIHVECDLRYINHSENPNAVYYDDLKVCALKDIHAGEEITHNYHQTAALDEKPQDKNQAIHPGGCCRQRWLPWLLLIFSWLGMAAYLMLSSSRP